MFAREWGNSSELGVGDYYSIAGKGFVIAGARVERLALYELRNITTWARAGVQARGSRNSGVSFLGNHYDRVFNLWILQAA